MDHAKDGHEIGPTHPPHSGCLRLEPAPWNPREISPEALDGLQMSIAKFGVVEPVVINNRTGHIVGGHQRVEALKRLGIHETQVVVVDIDELEEKALNLSLNNPAIAGTFTRDIQALLAEIKEVFPHEVYEGLRFDEIEFPDDPLFGGTNGDPDAIPDVAEPITKPGDLWILGEHRLLCGDSTKAEDVGWVMAGQEASAVVSDPPYGISFDYGTYNDARGEWFGLMNAVVPMMRSRAKFVVIPCCGLDRLNWWYLNHKPDWIIAWYKGSPGHCSHVGFNDWEAHLVWGKPPSQIHDYFQTSAVLKLVAPVSEAVEWAAWLIERAARESEIVLDPFLGSGTMIIAAETLGRRCYAMEIEPRYVDVSVKRWEQFTGKKAVLAT